MNTKVRIMGINFDFRYSVATILKTQSIAKSRFDLSLEDLGGLDRIILVASCTNNPDEILNMKHQQFYNLTQELNKCEAFKQFMKDADYIPTRPKKKRPQAKRR